MLATIKSDIKKLFSVRSTYILFVLMLLITIFFSFWLEGYAGKSGSPASEVTPSAIHEIIVNSAGMVATFTCIIAILQVGHEYRYNTIMYTLTASRSRLRVFLSKILVLPAFSLVMGTIIVAWALGCYLLGISLRDASLPPQEFNLVPELARGVFYMLAYGLLGTLLGILLRSVISAIVVFFLLPSMVEPLLSLILKDKAAYLPITSFDQIMGTAMGGNHLSPNTAVITASVYLAVLGIAGIILFLKRDAN